MNSGVVKEGPGASKPLLGLIGVGDASGCAVNCFAASSVVRVFIYEAGFENIDLGICDVVLCIG